MTDTSALRSPATDWRLLWHMTRPAFLLLSVVACLLGMACAWSCGHAFDATKAVATLALAVIAHAGANVLNDYHDARNGADAANQQGLSPFSGGSRLIQRNLVSERATGLWAGVLLSLLIPAGVLLAWHSGPGLLWIGLAGVFLAWAYSAPPLALMSRGLGELSVGLAWWLMVQGAVYVQYPQWLPASALAAVSFGLLVVNVLLANGFADAPADALVGKRTLVVRLGARTAAWLCLMVALLAHGWLVWAVLRAGLPAQALGGLASLPLALMGAGLLLRHGATAQHLRPAVALSIAAPHVHGLGMAAGLVFAG